MATAILPGFQDRNDVHLGGINLNTYDQNNVAWAVTDIQGWWELPPINVPDPQRPYFQDGGYTLPGRFLSRSITITGSLIPPADAGRLSVVTARDMLAQAMTLVRTTALLIVDEDIPKAAEVQVTGYKVTSSKINGAQDFEITLRAADPRKYSASVYTAQTGLYQPAGGRTYNRVYPMLYGNGSGAILMRMFNEGTYETNAQLRINGPVQNPRLDNVETGQFLQFNSTIPADNYVTINLFNRSILLNDSVSYRYALSNTSSWFTLGPGYNSIRFTGAAPDITNLPTLSAVYKSAWIY